MEQLISLLEENSCLWDVSNKDYYLRKKRERTYKQIEEKLETERAVIRAKITILRQQCWQLLRSFACTTQQVPISANNSQHCWVRLHGPLRNSLFCVDNIRRIHILINWLGLKGLKVTHNARSVQDNSRYKIRTNNVCAYLTLTVIILFSLPILTFVQ